MNRSILIGRLVRDPELRYLPGTGTATCSFTIAVDRGLSKEKREEAEAKKNPTADFIKIVTWAGLAENCANYLVKGRLVAIEGKIQTGSYTDKNQVRRSTFEIVADSVKFLEWGDKQNKQTGQGSPGGMEGFYPTEEDDDIPF